MNQAHPIRSILPTLILVLGLCLNAVSAQVCLGPRSNLPGINVKKSPPSTSAAFAELQKVVFRPTRTGVYTINATVSIGKGAGAPVDFSLVKVSMFGKSRINEIPPPIAGTPKPKNGWTYAWSIYFSTVSKSFEFKTSLLANTNYTLVVEAKGTSKYYTPYHRRNYGVFLSGTATYCGVAASVKSVGTGCVTTNAAVLSAPKLPQLGQLRDLMVKGTANTSGLVAFGLPTTKPTYLGAGCSVYIDLSAPILTMPVITGASGAGFVIFMVPNDSALAGLRIAAQAALNRAKSPLGMDLSQGLELTLGY